MFKILNETEKKEVIEKYLKVWNEDIWSITSIEYNGVIEYLVNEHYLFNVKKNQG